jgi:protein gp37
MNRTGIAYADFTWNPFLGCSRVSPGCEHCYAERLASTRLAHLPQYAGLTTGGHWNGTIRLLPERLDEPLRRRKPARIFLGDMGDLFHPGVPFEFVAAIFGVMAACPQHTFLVLTKRAARMLGFFWWVNESSSACGVPESMVFGVEATNHGVDVDPLGLPSVWPLPNVHLGVTCEDQQRANDRIPLLLQCPAAVRWVSAEPLLEGIDFDSLDGISLVVVGGESGPQARQCDVEWIRNIVGQCREAGTKCFVKQVGENACWDGWKMRLRDRHGADPDEWPSDLRVREYPEVTCEK